MGRASAYACYRCGQEFPLDVLIDSRGCPNCFSEAPSNLHMVYRGEDSSPQVDPDIALPSLWRYADRLPFDRRYAISLGEGLTPLLPTTKLGAAIGVPSLLVKNEGCNPTWSHKDRFSTVAITAAVHAGAKMVATSSTGNAGASLAAYAARAGLPCIVATLAGSAGPMLTQIHKYGARVVPFKDKSDRWAFLAEGVERFGWFATSPYRHPVVGSHPVGIEGYKTIAFEIVEQMGGKPPDWCALPVCYGDALTGIWLGFREMLERGEIDRMPKMLAAEVHGSLAQAIAQQTDRIPDMPAAFDALAVSIGATRSTFQALKALRDTKGTVLAISNAGLVSLQEKVAATEGLFLELSSTVPIAAIREARQHNIIGHDETVVAVVTASGLKDIDRSASPDTASPFDNVETALRLFENGGRH